MTRQPSMFEPMLATVRGRQGELFAEADAPPCGLSCGECGRPMVRTASGYLSCPMAHGKLITEAAESNDDEPRWDAAGNCTRCGEAGRCDCHHDTEPCHCEPCLRRSGRWRGADPDPDDEPTPPHPWPVEARLIAKRHAARDNWLGRRWHCRCGACRRAKLDGFIPRESRR